MSDDVYSMFLIAASAAQRTRGMLRRAPSGPAAPASPPACRSRRAPPAQARRTWICSSLTEHAAMSAGTAGAAPLPIAAIALADMRRTFGSGSFRAAVSCGSAGSASGAALDAAPSPRGRASPGSGPTAPSRARAPLPSASRGSCIFAAAAQAAAPVFARTMLSTPSDVARRGRVLAEADEGQRVAALRQPRPADLVVRADVRLVARSRRTAVCGRTSAPGSCSSTRRDRRLAVEQHGVDAVVRALRDLRVELVVAVLRHVERDLDLRARPSASKMRTSLDQKRSGKIETLPFSALTPAMTRLDLDLHRVALRQARGAVGHGRLVRSRCPPGTRRRPRHQVDALAEGRLDRAVGVERPALVLDVEAERLLERDRVDEVPAVRRHARAEARAVGHGDARSTGRRRRAGPRRR